MQLAVAFGHDREQVAADAAHHRTDHTHHGVGGNGRVDGVPSLCQNYGPGLGRQRMFGGDDAVRGHHHRAALRSVNRDFGHS